MKKLVLVALSYSLMFLVLSVIISQTIVGAQETDIGAGVDKYVGQNATVCGNVASAVFASISTGKPTFLHLGQPYPNQSFTVVIWNFDRAKFGGPPEIMYQGKEICVTGLVELYGGKPGMTVHGPEQIIPKDNKNDQLPRGKRGNT